MTDSPCPHWVKRAGLLYGVICPSRTVHTYTGAVLSPSPHASLAEYDTVDEILPDIALHVARSIHQVEAG